MVGRRRQRGAPAAAPGRVQALARRRAAPGARRARRASSAAPGTPPSPTPGARVAHAATSPPRSRRRRSPARPTSRSADATQQIDWANAAAAAGRTSPWPAQPGRPRHRSPRHRRPVAHRHSRAAIPLTAPLSSGYRITKTVTPVEPRDAGPAQRRRPPARPPRGRGAERHDLGGGRRSDPRPAPRTSAPAWRATRRSHDRRAARDELDHRPASSSAASTPIAPTTTSCRRASRQPSTTIRLNQSGHFELPPTRVEALYAPEMFGEIPNAPSRCSRDDESIAAGIAAARPLQLAGIRAAGRRPPRSQGRRICRCSSRRSVVVGVVVTLRAVPTCRPAAFDDVRAAYCPVRCAAARSPRRGAARAARRPDAAAARRGRRSTTSRRRCWRAVIASEDRRFFAHGGVDWRAARRGAVAARCAAAPPRGASTITMQLAALLDPALQPRRRAAHARPRSGADARRLGARARLEKDADPRGVPQPGHLPRRAAGRRRRGRACSSARRRTA